MGKGNFIAGRPAVDPTLFWDWDINKTDFKKAWVSVIERIIEKGTEKEWEAMIAFYGRDKVEEALKTKISFLPQYILRRVTSYFSLAETEMKCCTNKRSPRNYWI